MSLPFATQSDLEGSLGRALTSAEVPKATAALRYASNLVRAQYPAVNLLHTVPDAVVDAVTSLAERRFLGRRDGVALQTVGNVTTQYGTPLQIAGAANASSFTPDERLLLNATLGLSGNMTVSLAGPDPVP
jgi:hypothetical protein